MKPTALQLALRKTHRVMTAPRVLGGLVIFGGVLGISGPFQTFEAFALPARLAYWLAMCGLTFTAGYFAGTYAELGLQNRLRRWPRFGAGALASAVAVCGVVFLFNTVFLPAAVMSSFDMLALAGYVVIISFGVSAALRLFASPPPAPASEVRILARLPFEKRGPVISLTVEDHYTEVTTTKGRHLVLLRLSDAMAEAGDGVQIHRSHWVALRGIAKVERVSGKVVITTVTGAQLPVSRSFLPAIKAAGLVP